MTAQSAGRDDFTLLLGVGATKAGTSWLYRFLASHPDCHLRSVKEVHYFDSLGAAAGPGGQTRRRAAAHGELAKKRAVAEKLQARWTRREKGGRGPGLEDIRRMADLLGRIEDLEHWLSAVGAGGDGQAYLDYLTAHRNGARLVADITPAYALLSAERLAEMAALGPRVRFVYLMRDPVERAWSHCRMLAGWADRKADEGAFAARALARVDALIAGGEAAVAARGDYCAALERLDQAVPEGQLITAFFEDLFDQAAIDALCARFGISPVPAPVRERVHAGRGLSLDPARRGALRALLEPQYACIVARFGDLPAAWRRAVPT